MPALRRPGSFVWLCIKIRCFSQSLNSYHTIRGRAACQESSGIHTMVAADTFWHISPCAHLFSKMCTPFTRLGPLSCACSLWPHSPGLGHEPAPVMWLGRAGLRATGLTLEGGLKEDHVNASPSGRPVWITWTDKKEGRRAKERKKQSQEEETAWVSVGSPAAWTPRSQIP